MYFNNKQTNKQIFREKLVKCAQGEVSAVDELNLKKSSNYSKRRGRRRTRRKKRRGRRRRWSWRRRRRGGGKGEKRSRRVEKLTAKGSHVQVYRK